MADLNMPAVISLSGRIGLVTGGGTGMYVPDSRLRLATDCPTEDLLLRKPLLQTGPRFTSLADGWTC